MEKRDERKRYVWANVGPAKKKNRNVTCKRSCNNSTRRENIRKKKSCRRYEINCSIAEKIEIEIRVRFDKREEKNYWRSSRSKRKHYGWKRENRGKKQKNSLRGEIGAEKNFIKEKIGRKSRNAKEKIINCRNQKFIRS